MTGAPLLFAAALSISGENAMKHASALAALGPHAFGSPRGKAAAAYVAAEFREVGLSEVRLQDIEASGQRGANVIGVLRAPGPEFVVIGAHHDSTGEAPGGHAAGGVGVLIEAARTLAQLSERPRTLVFVSFDAGCSDARSGARQYLHGLGGDAKNLVAALAIESAGWRDGAPGLQAPAYPDPVRPGQTVIAPGWLVRGALGSGQGPALGDRFTGLLVQPLVRAWRARIGSDDEAFLQAGLPALAVTDVPFARVFPHQRSSDTADKLDPAALAQAGKAVLGIVDALSRSPLSRAAEAHWYSAFGSLVTGGGIALVAGLSLLPGLVRAYSSGSAFRAARFAQAVLFVVIASRHPVPAVFVLALPNALTAFVRGRLSLLGLVPLASVAALALWSRGVLAGLWLQPWELIAAASALGLLWVGRPGAAGPVWRKAAGPKKKKSR